MPKTGFAVASHAGRVPAEADLSPSHAVSVFAALAQPTRLAIVRLLLKHEPVGITAGVIANSVGAPHNTISTHLAILVRAGLLRSTREGRTIIYRADIGGMRSLVDFLVHDCCDGHPELCNLLSKEGGIKSCDCVPAAKPRKGSRASKKANGG